jgi:hypothetical protein
MDGFHKYCDECGMGIYVLRDNHGWVVFSAFERSGGVTPKGGPWLLAKEGHPNCRRCSNT